MKRFLVFTLIALFATTCLLLTNLYADDNDEDFGLADAPFDDVFGSVGVSVWYDDETSTASGSFSYFLDNGDDVIIGYSYIFYTSVSGSDFFDYDSKGNSGHVAVNGDSDDDKTFTFDMEGEEEGRYTITGSTYLSIYGDTDHDGEDDAWHVWEALAVDDFEIE